VRMLDLVGKRFGKLVVLNLHHTDKKRKFWECICDCGNKCVKNGNYLTIGHTKSCGCLAKIGDITGKKFGKLTVISFSHKEKTRSWFLCKCDCGNECYKSSQQLLNQGIFSCGCAHIEHVHNKLNNECVENTNLKLLRNTEKIYRNNTSGVRGVKRIGKTNKFRATISFQGKIIHLGCFNTIQEAAKARKVAEDEYFKPILEKYEGVL